MSLPQLIVLDLPSAEAFEATPRDICISILPPEGESPHHANRPDARLSPSFDAVLRLRFDDAPWDHPPEGCVQITEAQGADIVDFFFDHVEAERLVIHCEAGASRSVSVAMALADGLEGYGAWKPAWMGERRVPNKHVYNAVLAALRCQRVENLDELPQEG